MSEAWLVLLMISVPLAVTGVLAWRIRRSLARAERTQGTIVEMLELPGSRDGRSGKFYAPVVEFSPKDGSNVRFRARSFPDTTLYRRGQAVDVLYDPSDPPSTAQLADESVWRPLALPGCVTVLVLGWTVVTLLQRACS